MFRAGALITVLVLLLGRHQMSCSTDTDPQTVYYNLTELLPPGTLVGDVRADSGLLYTATSADLARMIFDIQSTIGPTVSGSFVVDRSTGLIRTGSGLLSRNAVCPYQATCDTTLLLRVTPVDLLRFVRVVVRLIDVNDATPTFPPPARMSLTVVRGQLPVGAAFPLPAADDRDGPSYGVRSYRVPPSAASSGDGVGQPFDVRTSALADGSTDVRLVVVSSLLSQDVGGFRLSVLAVDGGSPPLTGTLLVNVTIAPGGNGANASSTEAPTSGSVLSFDRSVYFANVTENSPVGTSVTRMTATGSTTSGSRVVYGFDLYTTSVYSKMFGIDNATGEVRVTGSIDREKLVSGSGSSATAVCSLVIVAVNPSRPTLGPAYARLSIAVLDVNDNAPSVFVTALTPGTSGPNGSVVDAQLPENSPLGTPVVYVSAADPDAGTNGTTTCRVDISGQPLFRLDPVIDGTATSSTDYVLATNTVFDRGHQSVPYSITVTCQDAGTTPLASVRLIRVVILDAGPTMSAGNVTVDFADRNSVGDVIATIQSTTTDVGSASIPAYSIRQIDPPVTSSSASIGFRSGIVVAGVEFRYVAAASPVVYRYLVTATDSGAVPMSATATLAVRLVDSTPHFEQPAYAFALVENQPAGTTVGLVSASVDRPSSGCRYSIVAATADGNAFAVDAATGVVTTSSVVRRSNSGVAAEYRRVTVVATNADRPLSSTTVDVAVLVVSGPSSSLPSDSIYFRYPPVGGDNVVRVPVGAPIGYFVVQLSAASASGTSSKPPRYSIVGGNVDQSRFSLDPDTGVLRTAVGDLGAAGTVCTLAVGASVDGGGSAVSVLVVIIVPPTAASLASTSPAAAGSRQDSGSTESTWWTDNGQVVIATSAAVSTVVVVVVVLVVVCVICRLRKANREVNKQLATVPAPSLINSEGLPRTLPSSRASTPYFLDDLCSCSRRSSRRGGSSQLNDSFDAGFSIRFDGAGGGGGSSSSGVYCSSSRSPSHSPSRPGSSLLLPAAEMRALPTTQHPAGVDLRHRVGHRRGDDSPRKYDSDSGVDTSYLRHFTPSPARSQYSGSVSGVAQGGATSGGVLQRRVDRHHRAHSSTSPTGSRGTNRSSSSRPNDSRLDDVIDGCQLTALPSQYYDRRHHHHHIQPPVIMAGHCTVTVRGSGPTQTVLAGRRRQTRRSPSYRLAASTSSSGTDTDRGARRSSFLRRPASSSPPRSITHSSNSGGGRGSASVGGSPPRSALTYNAYSDIGLPPRSPAAHKFAGLLTSPLRAPQPSAAGFEYQLEPEMDRRAGLPHPMQQQQQRHAVGWRPSTTYVGCQGTAAVDVRGSTAVGPPRRCDVDESATVPGVATRAAINPRDYQIPSDVDQASMQRRVLDYECRLATRTVTHHDAVRLPYRSDEDALERRNVDSRNAEAMTRSIQQTAAAVTDFRNERSRSYEASSQQQQQQRQVDPVDARANESPDGSCRHRQMSPIAALNRSEMNRQHHQQQQQFGGMNWNAAAQSPQKEGRMSSGSPEDRCRQRTASYYTPPTTGATSSSMDCRRGESYRVINERHRQQQQQQHQLMLTGRQVSANQLGPVYNNRLPTAGGSPMSGSRHVDDQGRRYPAATTTDTFI